MIRSCEAAKRRLDLPFGLSSNDTKLVTLANRAGCMRCLASRLQLLWSPGHIVFVCMNFNKMRVQTPYAQQVANFCNTMIVKSRMNGVYAVSNVDWCSNFHFPSYQEWSKNWSTLFLIHQAGRMEINPMFSILFLGMCATASSTKLWRCAPLVGSQPWRVTSDCWSSLPSSTLFQQSSRTWPLEECHVWVEQK